MGSVGDAYGNTLAETINGLYQAESMHRRARRWKSTAAVELATLAWIFWLNHARPLAPIGNMPPAEAEELHERQQTAASAMSA